MRSEEWEGRVAVVTGGASGIGYALAEKLLRRGVKVVLADIEAEALEAAAERLRSFGTAPDACHAVVCDVSQQAAVEALAAATTCRFGSRVHLLFNNAGVGLAGPLKDASTAQWQWVLGVNLWGVIHGIQAFLPQMLQHGQKGHIVNTASMAGHISWGGLGVYSASKYAVVSISETLAQELKNTAIGVSVLCPLGVRTEIFRSARNKPHYLDEIPAEIDISEVNEEWLSAEEVAERVLQGIEQGQRYIFTHKGSRPVLEHRFRRLLNDLPHDSSNDRP